MNKKLLTILTAWLCTLASSATVLVENDAEKTWTWTASASTDNAEYLVASITGKDATEVTEWGDNGSETNGFQSNGGSYYFNTCNNNNFMLLKKGLFANLSDDATVYVALTLNYAQDGSTYNFLNPTTWETYSGTDKNGKSYSGSWGASDNGKKKIRTFTASDLKTNGLAIGGVYLNWNIVEISIGEITDGSSSGDGDTGDTPSGSLDKPGLHTDGTKVVDKNGNEFVMRGFNYSYAWQNSLWGNAFADANLYKCNAMRIQLTNGYFGNLGSWTRGSTVNELINSCKDNKIIGVFNVQDTGGDNETSNDKLVKAVDYWVSDDVCWAMRDNPDYAVLNIANEWMESPERDSKGTWATDYKENHWSDNYIDAINRIRAKGVKNLIMIDCNGYGQYADIIYKEGKRILDADAQWFADGKPNIIFSIHFYEKACYYDYDNGLGSRVGYSMDRALSIGAPLCIGEFGLYRRSGAWKMDWQTILAYCKTKHVGYLVWSYAGNGDADSYGLDMFDSSRKITTEGSTLMNHEGDGIVASSIYCSIYDGYDANTFSSLFKPFKETKNADKTEGAPEHLKGWWYADMELAASAMPLTITKDELRYAGVLPGRKIRLMLSGTSSTCTLKYTYAGTTSADIDITGKDYIDIRLNKGYDYDLVIEGSGFTVTDAYVLCASSEETTGKDVGYLYPDGTSVPEMEEAAAYTNISYPYAFNSGDTWGTEILIPGSFFTDAQEGWQLLIAYSDASGQISIKDGNHYSDGTYDNGVYYSWLKGHDSYNGDVDYSSISGNGTWTVNISDEAHSFADYKTYRGTVTRMLARLKEGGMRVNGHDWKITSIKLMKPKPSTEDAPYETGVIEFTPYTFSRNLSADYYKPISLPVELSQEQIAEVFGSGTDIVELEGSTESVDNITILFRTVNSTTANNPYLIKLGSAHTGETYTVSNVNAKTVGDIVSTTVSVGNVNFISTAKGSDGSDYSLLKGNDNNYYMYQGKLYLASTDKRIKQGLAYIHINSTGGSAKTCSVMVNDDTVTTISLTATDSEDKDRIYNLHGQRLDKMPSTLGIYIVNGKKVCVGK